MAFATVAAGEAENWPGQKHTGDRGRSTTEGQSVILWQKLCFQFIANTVRRKQGIPSPGRRRAGLFLPWGGEKAAERWPGVHMCRRVAETSREEACGGGGILHWGVVSPQLGEQDPGHGGAHK